jgi:SET domain
LNYASSMLAFKTLTCVACQDIAAGEEIFVNYGATYFEEEPEGCPCLTCKPVNTDQRKDEDCHIRRPLDTNSRRTANQRKRARQAENRKKCQLMTVRATET